MKRLFAAALLSVLGLSTNAYSMEYTLETIEYPDSVWTRVNGINNKGHVVGSYNDGIKTHGYIYNGNSFTIVDFPGAVETSLENINDAGKVVGWYNYNGQGIGFNKTYGFSYDNTAYISIIFPGPDPFPQDTSMNGINNKDTIVGGYWTGGAFGFIYDKGATSTYGWGHHEDINDKGTIVAYDPDAYWSRLVYNGKITEFKGAENVGEIYASGINNLGQVVGNLINKDLSGYNFIYDGKNLNPVDLPGPIFDINDKGQIIGNLYSDGIIERAYIATRLKTTAIPEPSSMILLGLAGAGIFGAHRLARFDKGSRLA